MRLFASMKLHQAILLFTALFHVACGAGGPTSPSAVVLPVAPAAPAATVTLTFQLYNHTGGPAGELTRMAQTGSGVAIRVSETAVQAIDPDRIVIREGATGGRTGNFVAFSNQGEASFTAPGQDRAYDVFLMNSTPPTLTQDGPRTGTFYQLIDDGWNGTRGVRKRAMTAYRAPDEGGVVGPDEPMDTAIKVYDSGLSYPWMRYGSLTRVDGSGDMKLQYGGFSWCAGHPSGWGAISGALAGLGACIPNVNAWWYGWQQNLFQIITLYIHLDPHTGNTSSGFVLAPGGGWSQIGRDLIAYIYIRDPKAW